MMQLFFKFHTRKTMNIMLFYNYYVYNYVQLVCTIICQYNLYVSLQ